MIEIDASFVDAAAPNAAAMKNGRGLVLKNKLVVLHQSAEGDLLFGECQGSGKSNYHCSCDFSTPESPVYRCSCPSRQFPCKHCLGLLYAFVDGKKFSTAEVPEDIASKREKATQRAVKKKETAAKPKKVNKSALAKKIKTQLAGLDLLETLTHDMVRNGMGNTNAKTARQIEEQAKQMANAYLPGAQAALYSYTKLFSGADARFDSEASSTRREEIYSEAMDQLARLHALVRQGRAYLTRRLEDPELKPETESGIAAWLGHAWQLTELAEAGLAESNVELLQLAFNSYDDVARREYVDTGIWMDLSSGRIQLTQTFRPYKAAKHIKSEDSFFQVAQIEQLCVYPGDVNPRVRWEAMLPRGAETKDFTRVRKCAHDDFASLVKEVKSHLKSPLADKHPIYAINYAQMGSVGKAQVIEDKAGGRLVMTDAAAAEEPPSCYLLGMLPRTLHAGQTMIGRFCYDFHSGQLRVKPLSIVTKDSVIRLTL